MELLLEVNEMKKNILKGFLMAIVLILAVTVFVRAANDTDQAIGQQALNVRYAHLECKVNYTDTQIDLVNKYLNVDLSADKNTLNSDLTQLNTFVVSNNKTEFDSFVLNPLTPDFKNATQDLNNIKKDLKNYNLTNDTKTAFKNDLKAANQVYADCSSEQAKAMTNVMIKHMDNVDNRWTEIIADMQKKNISISDMQSIDQELKDRLQDFQNAITSGIESTIKEALQNLTNAHLHLYARFETSRLKGFMGRIGMLADRFNVTTNLSVLDQRLNDLSQYTTPGHKYQVGDFNKVWSTLKDTSKDLMNDSKDILSQMKIRAQEIRNQRILDRNNTGNRTFGNRNMTGNQSGRFIGGRGR